MKPKAPYNLKLEPVQQGLFRIPDKVYRQIKAFNITNAKLFNRSPLHVWTSYNDPEAEIISPTYAMDVGTAFHWAVLEPERFKGEVVIDLAINHNKLEYKQWKEDNSDKLIIRAKDYRNVQKMVDVLELKKSVKEFLNIPEGHAELACLWREPDYGFWCKAKFDWLPAAGNAIVDLKKTQVASKREFVKAIYRYDYYVQAAHYMNGFEIVVGYRPDDFVWIASEQLPPNECNVFCADHEEIGQAEAKLIDWYRQYAECLDTGQWPGYVDEVVELGARYRSVDANDNIPF